MGDGHVVANEVEVAPVRTKRNLDRGKWPQKKSSLNTSATSCKTACVGGSVLMVQLVLSADHLVRASFCVGSRFALWKDDTAHSAIAKASCAR